MNYCSLDDAYPGLSPGCDDSYSSKEARREERRRAKRCKGPAMAYQQQQADDKDPDRQHLDRPKEIQPLTSHQTGLRAHVPVDAPLGMEPFQDVGASSMRDHVLDFLPQQDKPDIINMQAQQSKLPSHAMLAQALPANKVSGFFGADPLDDGFANYAPDARNYLIEPNFTTAFAPSMPSGSALPVPSVRDVWKPLTPTGIDTAFLNELPAPGGRVPKYTSDGTTDSGDYRSMAKKIDTILSRLDDIQRGPNPEQSQKEILLFVSSGVLVLFLMDLLVRKGSSMRFLKGL
jgi:hypothetical protein